MKNRVTLRWSDESKVEIREIRKYFKDKNPSTGGRIIREIRTQAQDIKQNPFRGLNTPFKGIQRFLISGTSYFVVYELLPNEETPKTAHILSVISSLHNSKAKKYLER